MPVYKFSERAFAKMVLHAAKYPHLAVNGILLASKTEGEIVDAVPMFHQCLFTTPMVEIALMEIDSYAERENLVVAGYYCAAENFYDNSLEKAPAAKIAEKIQENYKSACFVLIDNTLMTLDQDEPPLKLFCSPAESGRWTAGDFEVLHSQTTLQSVSALLKRGAMKDVIDFDNYLDNPDNDWTNKFLNRDLKQIMAMY